MRGGPRGRIRVGGLYICDNVLWSPERYAKGILLHLQLLDRPQLLVDCRPARR
jgi:hypothetical protein